MCMNAINGLIMYLALLAVVKRVKRGRGQGKMGLTGRHAWLKANWKGREGPRFQG